MWRNKVPYGTALKLLGVPDTTSVVGKNVAVRGAKRQTEAL